MMNSRIRYDKTNEESVLESTRVFQAESGSYRVRLNSKELSYVVFNPSDDTIAASGTGASMQIVKKRVKESLESLGISFVKEKRQRETN